MNIFYSSDHHLFHFNIIRYCSRPFSSTEEMNEHLISEWNGVVKPNDIVRYLGDLTLSRDESLIMPLRKRMNGIWELFIAGNHDDGKFLHDPDLAQEVIIGSKNRKRRQELRKDIVEDGIRLVLSHYPQANDTLYGAKNLHGHVHANVTQDPAYPNHFHIGVDSWNYRPAEWSEIKALLR